MTRRTRTSKALISAGTIAGLALIVMAGGPVHAATDGPLAVVAETDYEIDPEQLELSVTITNLADTAIDVAIRDDDGNCSSAETVSVARSTAETIDFTLDGSCELGGDETTGPATTTLTATDADGRSDEIELTLAASEAASDPDYRALWGFVGGALLALAVWSSLRTSLPAGVTSDSPLDSIDSKWSFSDSWASNLGVAATLFTGVFGATNVLEKILGEDSGGVVTVAVVAAAISAGMIGTGPIVLSLLNEPDRGRLTARGIIAASCIVLAANVGLVATLTIAVWGLTGFDVLLLAAAVLVTLLLAGYTHRTVPQTLRLGSRKPPTRKPDVIVAAEHIAAAVRAGSPTAGPGPTSAPPTAVPPAAMPPATPARVDPDALEHTFDPHVRVSAMP